MDRIYLPQLLPLEEYEKIIVLFSGGKDSLACVLDLLERGVPRERIELWHHDIDGGHPDRKMDWPVTQAYVRAVSEYLGLVLRTSWRVNGFWGEVYRLGASWPIQYIEPDSGIVRECKLSEKQIRSAQLREAVLSSVELAELEQMGCRMKFPAKSGNLATRWCSSILKIMVADSVIRNIAMDELKEIGDCRKFPAKGSISSGRYCSPNLKREVADTLIRSMDGLRADGERMKFPAKSGCHQGRWCSGALKAQVWEIIKRWHIAPHPCYAAGWNRCSCAMCIFSLPKHWAGIRELFPDWVSAVESDERILGFTLDNKMTLAEYIGDAVSCVCHDDPKALFQLTSGVFSLNDVEQSEWVLPAGAFHGAEGGPC